MPELVWSGRFDADVQAIYEWLEEQREGRGDVFYRQLLTELDQLTQQLSSSPVIVCGLFHECGVAGVRFALGRARGFGGEGRRSGVELRVKLCFLRSAARGRSRSASLRLCSMNFHPRSSPSSIPCVILREQVTQLTEELSLLGLG